MAPYGSVIKARPSGQIMAPPITRPVVIPRLCKAGRICSLRSAPQAAINDRTAEERYELAPSNSITSSA